MTENIQPQLRFLGFEGAWKRYKFKDLYIFKSTNSLSRDKLNYEIPNVKNIHYGDIHVKFNSLFDITKEVVPYINQDVNLTKIPKNDYLKEGDVIIADASENYEDIGKSIEILNLNNEKVISGLHTFLCRKNSDLNYSGFMTFVFKSEKYRKQVYKIAQGTKVLSLSSGRVGELVFEIPAIPEQKKIANYLSSIDHKINLLAEKKKKLSRYKKAIMQQLFSQQIRFKNENGNDFPDWEYVQLKDILKEHKEKNIGDKYVEVLSVAKMKGVINQIEHLGRSYSAEKITHYKVINAYDIVYTKSPTSGFPFGIIKQNKLNRSGVLSPLYAVFKPKTKYLGMILHDIFLSEVETYNYLVPLVQKGAKNTMNINNDEFLKGKKYNLPTSIEEQQKIADFLSAIDESIDKVNEQIMHTQSFKKAMLQQMFV